MNFTGCVNLTDGAAEALAGCKALQEVDFTECVHVARAVDVVVQKIPEHDGRNGRALGR